ncbi:vacuolar iron transporter-like protein 4-like [Senna tora]|uniref:Vacuolar iron transporter-like protein 4-like n=1 Tax=Senna tora TaxID=362788 RepID=A0A834SHJ9_9FABA|nr:vacuolar iron transporter-like protein 4-like [Senna tora]
MASNGIPSNSNSNHIDIPINIHNTTPKPKPSIDDHDVDYSQRGQWLRAAVLGANDGLVSVASLMMGVGGVKQDAGPMLVAGFAGLVAGACSMAIGEFVSVYTQYDIEKARIKRSESSDDEAHQEKLPSPSRAALASALAFSVGALLPLLGAAFIREYRVRMGVVAAVVSLALLGFGGVGAVLGKTPVTRSCVRVLMGGWMAMAITFGLTNRRCKDPIVKDLPPWQSKMQRSSSLLELDDGLRGVEIQQRTASFRVQIQKVERQGVEVDLQEVFNRFNFDNISSIVLGSDPKSLAFDFLDVTCEKAFNEVEEFIFYRHIVPKPIWKFQKWLRVGPEKKMAEVSATFDKFLRESIISNQGKAWDDDHNNNDDECDLITLLMRQEEGEDCANDKFLRDTASSLFIAGKDTITSALTWLFWLVATHPYVEAKILQEMKMKDNNNNVYLHGAICEALRLYPPIPFK